MSSERDFTIKQAAERTGISADTIRYYEKIKLLPRAIRKENGHRIYSPEDIQTIKLISCLKKTGMPLEAMRPFLEVSANTDPADYPELLVQFKKHREDVVNQIASLKQVLDFIDMKLAEGRVRQECSDESDEGVNGKSQGESRTKPISVVEMNYFTGTIRNALNSKK